MPRQSPDVYRRRRIAAVVVLALVIALVWALIAGISKLVGGSGSQPPESGSVPAPSAQKSEGSSSPSASASSTPKPSGTSKPSASSEEYPLCYDEFVQVDMSTDKQSYKPGEKPVLIMKVTNTSSESCVINLGTKSMEFRVMNGNSPVFSTKDCQTGGEDLLKNVKPGASETARFTWDQHKSAPGCKTAGGKADPGTMQLVGKLGKVTSAPASFDIGGQ
ncbi:hypothetical protein [Arthrobacter sp. UM1]|uniref:hypothetical protein n=1 Tax=Arthrobacter sp. UM1 TaxID=2766776 RepID=UPI001CF619DF|nr:hypothetical protein [Arthrobacter sp. UM1]MCB4208858.1 hypothetical protein [Arthrobacter sp. UM1]